MARQIKKDQDYKGKLLKLIPTEIVAAYLAVQGFIPADSAKWGLSVIAVVLLIITPLYLKYVQKVEKTAQIIVSSLSFIVWIYTIGGPFILWGIHEQGIASAVLILWTMFIPQFFKTEPVQQQ
jgi:hypothetical protein